ncbi:MAG: efflux RND transporter periplasmic adaptor subunit [Candidatus Omnitrophota bacterium]
MDDMENKKLPAENQDKPGAKKGMFLDQMKTIKLPKFKISGIKKNYIWILLGILVVVVILTRSIGVLKKIFFEEKEKREIVEITETIPVKVYKVKRMDFKDTLPVMGRIEGSREIDIKFDGKGILESFNFEEGERILEGDIIASIDQKDALLKLKYAGLEMEKSKKLYDIGGVDKMALDQKKLEYESAKRDLEKTNIYAPSDGYLGSKEQDVGAFITSQDKIGTFVDFGEVYAAFDIIEEDSSKIELGQNVEVFLDAYPGVSYAGTVDRVSPMIEGRTRTQKVKVELDNDKGEMKPGMFTRAVVNTYENKDVLIIPASAFKKQENKYFVYIIHPEEKISEELDLETEEGSEILADKGEFGIVEQREVRIAYLTHDVAEIGEGLEEGELIIRELHREYKDKDRVEITEVQETIF